MRPVTTILPPPPTADLADELEPDVAKRKRARRLSVVDKLYELHAQKLNALGKLVARLERMTVELDKLTAEIRAGKLEIERIERAISDEPKAFEAFVAYPAQAE
jgi:hypothetical protein